MNQKLERLVNEAGHKAREYGLCVCDLNFSRSLLFFFDACRPALGLYILILRRTLREPLDQTQDKLHELVRPLILRPSPPMWPGSSSLILGTWSSTTKDALFVLHQTNTRLAGRNPELLNMSCIS